MRARNIKPGFFVNDKIGKLSGNEKILFIGLWCLADCEGFFEYIPKKIKIQIFPYELKINIEKMLCNLMSLHLITFNDMYGFIPKFHLHQRPHPHETKSALLDETKNILKNLCHDMSCNVMKCPSDIRNVDIRNEERGIRNDPGKTKSVFPDTSNEFLISETLQTKIKTFRPNSKISDIQAGAKIIDLMIIRDGRPVNEMLELIEWYPIGEKFIPEIFSVRAFREKYDKLISARFREKTQQKSPRDIEVEENQQRERERVMGEARGAAVIKQIEEEAKRNAEANFKKRKREKNSESVSKSVG